MDPWRLRRAVFDRTAPVESLGLRLLRRCRDLGVLRTTFIIFSPVACRVKINSSASIADFCPANGSG